MNYPTEHKQIVSNLLEGKFIIYPNPLFVKIQEQAEDYKEFFSESFGYELKIETEYTYLISDKNTEKSTRDFVLFLAVLCRELDYSGKNFREQIELATFDIAETEQLLRQSSKWEILDKTSVASSKGGFEGFINTWNYKNVLTKSDKQFKFTKAVKLFFEFAVNIANAKMKEEKTNL
ncbi:hypothetical protein FACS1894156_1090 [Bacteroidia bacterium]|nr:hypothetical protein FACS1894156_1090 [Bacteroidia bacterium]